ncbi:hypothetical protein B566_EDAN017699 [Ephemera danica]|nr:hypothetical protein B566_EDAN017699 [Ephemera danica]
MDEKKSLVSLKVYVFNGEGEQVYVKRVHTLSVRLLLVVLLQKHEKKLREDEEGDTMKIEDIDELRAAFQLEKPPERLRIDIT